MNGADYIAAFLRHRDIRRVHCMTGLYCAEMIDAISRQPEIDYFTHFNNPSAALAAEATWRSARRLGVAIASGGTDFAAGIACAANDAIPVLYLIGQSDTEPTPSHAISSVIAKKTFMVTQTAELPAVLAEAWTLTQEGRPGPVVIILPVAVQRGRVVDPTIPPAPSPPLPPSGLEAIAQTLAAFLLGGDRPLLLLGGGVVRANVGAALTDWLRRDRIPFVASWGALSCFDHDLPSYLGAVGLHGNRGANFALRNCDRLLVLGSRLDTSLRGTDPRHFAPAAKVHVLDIDPVSLTRLAGDGYRTTCLDLRHLPLLLGHLPAPTLTRPWHDYLEETRRRYLGRDISTFTQGRQTLSPYAVVRRLSDCLSLDAVVIGDTGANLCWLFQMFHRRRHSLFAAGSQAQPGYALPAAIGAALEQPRRQVVAVTGDGGLQAALPNLQTLAYHHLGVAVVVFNNNGYGFVKRYQDQRCGGRHEASGRLYSVPDLDRIAAAFGLDYRRIDQVEQIGADLFLTGGPILIEICLDENTPIEPQTPPEGQCADQFPPLSDDDLTFASRFVPPRS